MHLFRATLSLLLFSVPLCLTGCSPNTIGGLEKQDGIPQLTAQEILALVEDNTLLLDSFSEDSYFFFDASSRLFGKDIYNNKDIGRWDVSTDGELCMRMQKWWYGDLRCFSVYKDNTTYNLSESNGVIAFRATHFSGDNKKLYHVVKEKNKKSYRRSAKKNQEHSASPSLESATADTSEPLQPAAPKKNIIEENTYQRGNEEKDLRSTVKWMARDCPGCNLAETDLKKADLVGAHLQGANLREANLRMANLRRADLEGANLRDAILSYCNLPGANLRNADLRGADLQGANLIRADLTGAKLEGAKLDNALLEGTQGLP